MAITKSLASASMRLNANGVAFVDRLYDMNEDGVFLGQCQNTIMVEPGDDYSNMPTRVQAVLAAFHTQAVIDAWNAQQGM